VEDFSLVSSLGHAEASVRVPAWRARSIAFDCVSDAACHA
jgi:hypothetical protein